MTIICIDLSHHNTVDDLADVKAAGTIAILHKCTEGTTWMDDEYLVRQEEAEAEGLLWGAYHFLKHGNATEQMRYFIANANLPDGSRVAIDYEDTACTLEDLTEAVDELLAMDGNWQIAVYGGSLLKQHIGKDYIGLLAANTSLWLAQYTTGTPSWPSNTWPHWTLWQYSDAGMVAGITGPVDSNKFNGSDENFAKWMGPAEAPAPAPEPEPSADIIVSVQTPPGIGVQVIVNGEVLT